MPGHCCVPYCNANYPTGPKVSVFSFPRDEELLKKWIACIPKENFTPSPSTKVCQRHFKPQDIITETSGYDSKRKITISVPLKNYRLKPEAVPSIFEDIPGKHHKKVKNSTLKDNQGKDNSESSIGTNLIVEGDKSPEKMDEQSDNVDLEQSTPASKSFSLPSPFKNLPNVSVCLKEEDRVPLTRELKGVKRSPSTGSNSSTGSNDAQKSSAVVAKRRKIEKPAPIVLGRQNDCYCWVCHRENIILCCMACPRAYHTKCAGEILAVTLDWVCPECQRILAAENVDTRSSTLAEISLEKLGTLLKLSLNKMKQRAPIAFHQPVSLEHYPLYPHYVIYPMDFSLLEKNIKQKMYGCTEAFLADVKWISHNSCVFNGTQHPLSTNAKNLVKACDQDMQEIEVCPDCFVHSVVRNKYWFSEVCRKPHPLVWAKLKGFPYWPAKVVRIVDGNVDARFFGAHDRAWVPVSQCYHLSKEMPTSSKPKKKGNYEVALDELNVHVHLLIQKFGCFEYAPCRTSFNPLNKVLMYHGIDIDKISKEDISIDNSIPQPEIKLNSEKENRFTSFMESEFEKSATEERKLDGSQTEVEPSDSLSIDEGVKSPSFLFKQRKSTDSVHSEKELSLDESKLPDESKNSAEVKSTNNTVVSSVKEPEKISDCDQLRKLEMALERIKGYVSLNIDSEKENNEVQNDENASEEKKEDEEKNVSEERKNSEAKKVDGSLSSTLLKETISLPIIESSVEQEKVEDVSIALEATKKTDSFFLKLNETIESCKAKLGISEINDDISSDESVGEDNASRSDEDEEDDTSVSDAEEASEEDEEEGEVMEVSDDEVENEDDESKLEDGESAEDSEEDEDSESSDTDIECTNEASPKKNETSLQNVSDENGAKEIASKENEISITGVKELTNDSNEAIIANPDMEVPEVTIGDSETLESESSNEVIGNSESSLNEQSNEGKSSKTVISPHKINTDLVSAVQRSSSDDSKDDSSNVDSSEIGDKTASSFEFNVNKNHDASKNVENVSSPIKNSLSRVTTDEKSDGTRLNTGMGQINHVERVENEISSKNEDDDDDEIFICTPTRPKSPPVIILDDDQENEDSSVSDTFAIKSPPYSTSAESFSNEENPAYKTNSDDEHHNAADKSVCVNGKVLDEQELNSKEKDVSNDNDLNSRDSGEKRKRTLSSGNSSDEDDDIQIVTPSKKPTLTGAIRTFNKPNNGVPTLKPSTPTMETVKRNLEKESLNQISNSPVVTEVTSMEVNDSPQEQPSPEQNFSPQSTDSILTRPVIDDMNLSEKDKDILELKSKLNCVLTAYRIQSWKCSQERDELRHNMNLIIMEMRACLESDKKQAIEALSQKLEQEKQKCIEETKRKQWCASCLMESRYACCWNTSYCSVDCQKRHFPEHRNSCTQLKNKSVEIVKTTTANSSENGENKKVIIVNMKHPDPSQQVSVSKSQIQVMPPKNMPLQIASSNNSSNNIQFLLAPIKSSTESSVITSTPTMPSVTNPKESSLDSAQIISQVRNKACDLGTAITLLKKKNESTLSFLSKKQKEERKQKDEANLEARYFPSPPAFTCEDYEATSPDPTLVFLENNETKDICDSDIQDVDLPDDINPEPDVVLSDTDDKDNEMINIGHGVEVKAKFLNKCLVYGQTAKKLTRCLVDIIFPDIKLLASCSAFGMKSNVTKLTRAALPHRKVQAIIDFVKKRYSDASRSEIVLAINMKCKEARVIVNRKESDQPKKATARRLLAREKEGETVTSVVTNITTSSPVVTSSSTKTLPNVVCVKSTSQNILPFNIPNKSSGPNILRCNTQILIRPKPVLNTVGNAAIIRTSPPKKRETVRNLLAANKMNLSMGNLPKDGTKLVMSLDNLKAPPSTTQPVSSSSTTAANMRPYIIIGSQANSVRPTSSLQPVQPASSYVNK